MVNFLTRDKILEAAINQYSLYNYHGATMRKIAEEVDIKPASIYFFFKNKEELFVAAFQMLLEKHLLEMKRILNEARDKSILEIFHSLLIGTIDYHKKNMHETNAYISLITSPPSEINRFLQEHMKDFDYWLIDSLTDLIKRDKPSISDREASTITKQFLLLMDGVFWEINLYDEEELCEQIYHALHIIAILLGGYEHEK